MKKDFSIYSVFKAAAESSPGLLAIRQLDGRAVTYGALSAKIDTAAGRLSAAGVKDGSKVFFLMGMCIDFYVIILALVKLGAVVVIVDPWMEGGKIEKTISAIEPGYFIGALKTTLYFSMFSSFRAIKNKMLAADILAENGRAKTAAAPQAKAGYEKTALITFTTGSTGSSKGVIRTHGMLFEQYKILCRLQKLSKGDRDLQPFPVFLLANLGRGVTSYIPWGRKQDVEAADMRAIYGMMENEKINILTASPAFLDLLMAEAHSQGAWDFPGIKKIFCGGGAVTRGLVEKSGKYFKGADFTAAYGSTEAEPICDISMEQLSASYKIASMPGTCAGAPVKETKVKIKTDGYAKLLKAQPGEILVSGKHVCDRYFDVDRKTIVMKPGDKNGVFWHNTGDIGCKDAKGRIWFCGRVNNLISVGNKKIPAEAVELAILASCGFRPVILETEGVNILVVEKKDEAAAAGEDGNIRAVMGKYGVKTAQTRVVGKIPKDPRHRTKIDYAKLRVLLGGKA